MANLEPTKQRRGLVAIDGAMALIVILLIIWSLSATLEAFLAGHAGPVLPAAIFSGFLFSACVALNVFVAGIDQKFMTHRSTLTPTRIAISAIFSKSVERIASFDSAETIEKLLRRAE